MKDFKNINLISGIDSLYYFIKTNENYDELFLDILDQFQTQKDLFERDEIDYTNKDICVTIKDFTLQYLNKAEGFYWFRDVGENFRVGFKDENKNLRLHNIQVQLEGKGIYTLGIKSLLSLVNDDLLKDVRSNLLHLTRADINCFVNYDFSFVDKTMFTSKKKSYKTISEFGSANKTQTIYVGKKPFLLRLYDKKEELKNSPKKEIMQEYFLNNGLDIKKPIFNIEFEMHRTYLRSLNILTVEDLLKNVNSLFKKSMDEIRLIDTSTIKQTDIKNNTKNRASTLPIWRYIKDSFNIDAFLQSDTQLKRVKRQDYTYTYNHFIRDFSLFLLKVKNKNKKLDITSEFVSILAKQLLDEVVIESREYKSENSSEVKKGYTDVIYLDKAGNKIDNKRLLDSGELIKPISVLSFRECSDELLEKEIYELENSFFFEDNDKKLQISQKLINAYKERDRRKAKNASRT